MSLLKAGSLVVAAYLAAGRTGSVATCLYLGIAPLETLIIALFMDIVQIPVYGLLIQASHKYIRMPRRFRAWIEERSRKIKERSEKGAYFKRLTHFKPLAVMVVSTIPFRGFGVFSACILAFLMGYRRSLSTLLIMCGSFIGAVLTILVFFFPARWLSAL
ncbi:MAG: small multi-drug export protein [Deltaproteobacteria bacterium]|nr:small multi-drug export protein [Deltaproteobacteria bacterium]